MIFFTLVHKIFMFYLRGELSVNVQPWGLRTTLFESTCTGESFTKELQIFCMFLYIFFMSVKQILIDAVAAP